MFTARPRFAAVAAAAGLLLVANGPSARAAVPATVAVPTAASAMLHAVAAVSKSDAWAVGSLIEHWNGRTWTVVPGAKTGKCAVFLYGVAARSASSAWAVGYCGTAGSHRPVIERWDGRHWRVQPSPGIAASATSQLIAVTATSRSNAWAMGGYQSKGRTIPLIEHWDGHAWKVQDSPVAGPDGAELDSVAALSTTSAWAAGTVLNADGAAGQSLIERWNGHGWRIQPSINPGSENALLGITALTGAQAWTAGLYTFGSNSGTLVEQWNGVSWAEPATPGPDLHEGLFGIAAHTEADVWTVGFHTPLAQPRTLILHWNGTFWKVVPSPSPSKSLDILSGVAVLSGSYSWAVGYQGHYKTLIEHWNGTHWKVTPSPN